MPTVHLDTPMRRVAFLGVLGGGLGVVGGLAGIALVRLIALLTNVALFHRVGWTLPSLAHLHPSPWIVVVAVAGGLVVAVIARRVPMIRGHGIPEAMEAILLRESRIRPAAALAKPLSAAIAIGTGGPFGAEGPIIVTGGALGSLLGQVIRVSPAERKILLASGAAGGMAAIFGTPIAAVVLATELLLFEFSTRTLVPLALASAVAGGVHAQAFGPGALFEVPARANLGLDSLPVFAVVGVVAGAVAIVLTGGLFLVEAGFRRLPISEFWHPVLGAAGFALVGLVVPRALGVGYDSIDAVLADRLAVGALAALAIGKLVAWWVALGSGTSGGTLAPILLIGGAVGGLLGALGQHLGLAIPPGAVAAVAMAATFGASTRASFTAIVFLFELTRDYDLILPLMIATVIAHVIAAAVLPDGLMTEKLVRRGLRVRHAVEVDPFRTTRVREVMSPPDGEADLDPGDAVAVAPDETVLHALRLMLEEDVDRLLVVEDGAVIGRCTRGDLVRARGRQLELERPQPGWRRTR
jgi:H+/Cl- antiporter ClcA